MDAVTLRLASDDATRTLWDAEFEATLVLSLGTSLRMAFTVESRSPADIAVEQPTRYELIVNRRTARALSLTIPPTIILRADRIID